MGLASALSTALTGLNAAETVIDVVGNNLANSNTVGFKSSSVSFATQFLQTKSLGSSPTDGSGGTNPRQVGLGTMVADITPNFNQGTIEISSNPTDLAIQGDGFFIVQSTGGSRLYTRNGIFKLNAENQLVTITGNRLLGYGVDEQFQVQTTNLVPLEIPLGSAAVAQPTSNVFLEGTLSPTGDLADSAEVIASGILTDAQWVEPTTPATVLAAGAASLAGVTITPSNGPGSVDAGNYYYRLVYADGPAGAANATEGTASAPSAMVTVAVPNDTVDLASIVANEGYPYVRVYRTAVNAGPNTTYYYVGETTTDYFNLTGATAGGVSPGGAMAVGDYYYRIEYPATGEVSTVSTAVHGTVGAGENGVQLDGLSTGGNPTARIYRTQVNAGASSDYYYVGQINLGDTSFTDTVADAGLGAMLTHSVNFQDTTSNAAATTQPPLDTTTVISGNYRYYVTYYDTATGRESVPSPLSSAVTVEPGRVHLSNIPQDTSGQYDQIRLYRNLATDNSTFYRLTTLAMGEESYTDAVADSTLQNNPLVDLEGPRITESTLLSEVLRRDGSTYSRVFDFPPGTEATLNFTGKKGGRSVGTQDFTIDDTTTVLDLITFMEQALGIQERPGPDPNNPIPIDANTGRAPGAYVDDGQLLFVGNNGVGNAIDIGLSGMQLQTTLGERNVNMPFTSVEQAVGESAVTDFISYDSLGIPIAVRLTMVLERRDSTSTVYRWFADSQDNAPDTGYRIAVGTGLISFDGEGNFTTATEDTVSIERTDVSARSPLEFDLDFGQLSGLAAEHSTLAVSRQDGSAPGVLTSFIVGEDGVIRGVFSNGITRDLGQIRLASFANPAGLEQKGENLFAAGVNSGLPVEGNPNEQGIGSIIAGAQELSNTDIGGNLIDLILASTMYRGNTRVMTTVQQMLDELLSLRR
ncbi:MAG: flagellar hook-basal body complex protein [Planctomycetota bacterium]